MLVGYDQRATVYTPDPTTGAYTVVAATGVACRLALVTVGGEPSDERAEIDAARRLLWGPTTTIAETAQIEVAGGRWNIRPGTLAAVRGPSGSVVYQRYEVVRAT